MKKKILVTIPATDQSKEQLKAFEDSFDITFVKESEITDHQKKETQILLGNVLPQTLTGFSQLEWNQLNSAGYEEYLTDGVLGENTLLTNATGAYGPAVSEHLIALMFSVCKKIPLYRDTQNQHEWADHGQVRSLCHQTILIVGLGDIGTRAATLLHAFGNRIIGIRRNVSRKPNCVDEIYTLAELDEILPRVDIVALCLPASSATHHLFGMPQFQKMKKTALFFNVGRGALVDSDALAQAVHDGIIAGAGIDVVDPEPLPADHALWAEPNVLLTPHISGAFHLPETLDRVWDITLTNLKHYQNGEDLINRVR